MEYKITEKELRILQEMYSALCQIEVKGHNNVALLFKSLGDLQILYKQIEELNKKEEAK